MLLPYLYRPKAITMESRADHLLVQQRLFRETHRPHLGTQRQSLSPRTIVRAAPPFHQAPLVAEGERPSGDENLENIPTVV